MNALLLAQCLDIPMDRAVKWAAPLNNAMGEYEIDNDLRQAAFLAQVGHESGKFQWVREIWGPTPAQQRYEGRADLGNVVVGDGVRFKGRGLIQITGRANYQRCGDALGLDLIEHPELLEEPDNAARSAGWFWASNGLNVLADTSHFVTITRRINGGTNGLAERTALYDQCLAVLKQ